MFLQKTIKKRVKVEGVGLHTGAPCSLTFVPAPAYAGVHFIKNDIKHKPAIQALVDNVSDTGYATTLGHEEFTVSTVEHCLSAVSALRIDNLFIELEGPEIPMMDGSALAFLEALQSVGLIELDAPRIYCQIVQPIEIIDGDKKATLLPYNGLRLSITIDFNHPSIGKQNLDVEVNELSFSREIASARTFGFVKDLEMLRARGLAKGAGLHNAVALGEQGILNPEGLRFPDEFVRHKALDALGDLLTLGSPVLGHLILYKAGHNLMNQLIQKVIQTTSSHRFTELGSGVKE